MVATVSTPIYLKSLSKARHCAKWLHYFLYANMVSRYYLHFTNEETVCALHLSPVWNLNFKKRLLFVLTFFSAPSSVSALAYMYA